MATPPRAFETYYIGWLIAVLIIITCFLGIIGVVPGDGRMFFALIGALALAVFFRWSSTISAVDIGSPVSALVQRSALMGLGLPG